MWKYALGGLLLTAVLTYFLAGYVLRWAGHVGPFAVVATAVGIRVVLLVLVVWLGLSLFYRGPGRLSCFL
jgi:hypothetical protein